uniref:COesterase domain-containing protein n=1 Tax=Parastrongyloides trichosuri TaxID=131310 RepID=A0A0N4ZRS0_PARTI
MKKINRSNILFILIILITLLIFLNASNPKKRVQTSFGILRGETILPEAEDLPAITQYLGVPYGVSPTGQNRYNLAISAAKWIHMPKDAFKISSVCMQTKLPATSESEAFKSMSSQKFDYIHRLLLYLKPESEDCLYMNFYIPEKLERHNGEKELMPALLIVHGDDYNWNSGNPYNGSLLAAYGQIAVITLNYRLGPFGFLGRCETSSCTGNAGLSDLVAGLKMLSKILPSFGVNPEAITLMGWGSGANLISLLMASPITLPKSRLFHRAILLDGTALQPGAMQENPQEFFFKLAEELDCISKEKDTTKFLDSKKDIRGILRCLQDHSAENITEAATKLEVPTFLNAFAPIIDGQIVPNHPKISFSPQFGSLFREVDVMIGTVNHPAHSMLPNDDLLHGFDNSKRNKILRTLVRNLYSHHRKEIFDAIIHEYTEWNNPNKHPKQVRNEIINSLGDVFFTTPLIQTARMHSTDEQPRTGTTFFFLFSYETKAWTKEYPTNGIRGSLTGDHVPYILGYPLLSKKSERSIYSGFNKDDRDMSKVMMNYVSNFIKSGDPTKPRSFNRDSSTEIRFENIIWPQFNQANREAYLDISSDQPRIRNYYRNNYVGFWSEFIPQLINSGKDSNLPEEHSFLPDHFNKNSFFGNVKHYGNYRNEPFPPPPMPPVPIPPEVLKKLVDQQQTNSNTSILMQSTSPPTVVNANSNSEEYSKYSSILSLIVVVGCGMLVLNVCFCLGLKWQYDKHQKPNKSTLASYQRYNSSHISQPGNDMMGYIQNSPVRRLTLLPPPPSDKELSFNSDVITNKHNSLHKQCHSIPANTIMCKNENNIEVDKNIHINKNNLNEDNVNIISKPEQIFSIMSDLDTTTTNSRKTTVEKLFDSTARTSLTNTNIDKEPLLSSIKKQPINTLLRPGVSPTCPKHGRSAAIAMELGNVNNNSALRYNNSQGNHMPQLSSGPLLEEVQV